MVIKGLDSLSSSFLDPPLRETDRERWSEGAREQNTPGPEQHLITG